MQRQAFSKELEFLRNPNDKLVPDLVNNLNLFLDKDGLIRCDGRIGKTTYFDQSIINPVLLAKDHCLTKLIIEQCHLNVKHLGIQSTLNNLRLSGFWVPRSIQSIKNVISPCIACRKCNALNYKYPKVTNLPKNRVNLVRPYLHTGVDYTGSIIVREGKKDVKYYMIIFTCLSIRSIHIELVPDMSVNNFVLSLIRFTNLYGIPSHIYSDNGRSLIAGVNLVSEVFVSSTFKEKYGLCNIKHIAIPLYSPWIGAVWERSIKTLKNCLQRTLGRVKIGYFRLVTLLSDIQQAVNSRPLTYRCSEDTSLEIITPNCFLRPNANVQVFYKKPEGPIRDLPSRSLIIKSMEVRERVLESFREIWYREYLLGLRQLHKNLHQVDFANKIKVNDVVLIRNPAKNRKFWKLGKVLELYPGSDGIVRAVKVFRGDENYRTHPQIVIHSLKHLYPLELSITHDHVSKDMPMPANIGDVVMDESRDEETCFNDLDQEFFDNFALDSAESQTVGSEAENIVTDNMSENLQQGPDGVAQDPDTSLFVPINRDRNNGNLLAVGQATEESNVIGHSRRSKRVASQKMRPLDDQFLYY